MRQADWHDYPGEHESRQPVTRWTTGCSNCHNHGWLAWRPRCSPFGFMTIWYRVAPLVKVAHPAMLQAIAAGKKNDRVDARKIADLLRCDYFSECHMAPCEIRDRTRVLRYRNLLVRQMVQMKNKVSGLLMEVGVPYNQQKVHQKKYFAELLQEQKKEMPPLLPELLRLSRSTVEALTGMQRRCFERWKGMPCWRHASSGWPASPERAAW